MELAQILDALGSDETTKTASDETVTEGSAQSETTNKLSQALDAALREIPTESKVAGDLATPGDDLTKIATRLASAEQEAIVKEAELYGAAICDGFMVRMGQYEESGAVNKTAAHGEPTPDNFEKFASENPDLVKQAVDLGYRETKHQLEKVANDAYSEGYTKTAEVIKVAAEDCARKGMDDTYKVLSRLNQ